MSLPEKISADYTLSPNDLTEVLALLVEDRQPAMVWGPAGAAKSQIAQQVAAATNRHYVDIRALLHEPVDLRGIPWRDSSDRTRWASPDFLPPADDPGRWLLNLEELPSAVPMVQAALYQLVLDRKIGEYTLPEGASLIACGNRETDRGIVHRMPAPLASRFVHLEIRVDAAEWCEWGAANGIEPEVLFFLTYEPDLLHGFDPESKERAYPCPRTWEFASNIVKLIKRRNGLRPAVELALFRGTVGEAAAVEFYGVPERLARAAPSEGGPERPRERGDPGERQRADGSVRFPLPARDGRHHRPHRHLRAAAPAGSRRIAGRRVRAPRPGAPALARLHPLGRCQDSVKEEPMDLNRDAMLVGLRITAWSGRLYDREASDHVAVHHDASASAGRYNKRLLPKAAFATLTATMSEARTRHYANSLPWDDKGLRLLTVANYERYTELMDGLRERVVRQRARFIEDYDHYVAQARLDLGKLFRIEEYPSKETLQDRFSISYRITPVPDADHFIAKLATDDTDRVKRDIERHVEEQLHEAVGDLYRRLAEAVERVSKRLDEDENGKPLVFRDTMISNIRDLVDVVPRLNIFGDQRLASLCEQVKDRIAGVEPDSLRPSRTFDPAARDRVKRDADELMEQFAGYFSRPPQPGQEAA